MKKVTFVILMLAASVSFAQNAPIDFETGGHGATWTWTVFENGTNPPVDIIANPNVAGVNTSATVAKFTALQAGQPWAGCESAHGATNLGGFVLDATNSLIKIKVWKTVISDVGIKLVAPTGWALPEIKVPNTQINQWEELTFNFSGHTNPPASEGAYDQIVIFPDFNLAGRTQDNIVYFDHITFNPYTAPPSGPAIAAPTPPARLANEVISVFSGAYANISNTDFNPGWGQSTIVTMPTVMGDSVLKYANFNYQGTQFGAPLDVSGMDTLHLDMWTDNATSVNIFCISTGPVEVPFALPITPNQWVSYDIPLSHFSGVNLADLIQFKFDGGNGGVAIYLDNIYFYKQNTIGIKDLSLNSRQMAIYPNPAKVGDLVNLGAEVLRHDLFELSGRRIEAREGAVINTTFLEPGVYLVRYYLADGKAQTQKLIVL